MPAITMIVQHAWYPSWLLFADCACTTTGPFLFGKEPSVADLALACFGGSKVPEYDVLLAKQQWLTDSAVENFPTASWLLSYRTVQQALDRLFATVLTNMDEFNKLELDVGKFAVRRATSHAHHYQFDGSMQLAGQFKVLDTCVDGW